MFTFPAESSWDPAQGQCMSVDWRQSVSLLTSFSKTQLARNDESNMSCTHDKIPVPILNKKFKEKAHIGIPQENLTIRKLGFWIDHIAPLGSYIFVFTLDIWEFNVVQSCHIISVMFHWIITWSPTLEPYLQVNAFEMVWEQDQKCCNYMQTNLKNNQRSFKSQTFWFNFKYQWQVKNMVGDLDPKRP